MLLDIKVKDMDDVSYANEGIEFGFIQTSLGKIYYKHIIGEGDKLLLIHGVGSYIETWDPLIKYFKDGQDIWIIDLLGHGRSDAPEIEYTVKSETEVIREFVISKNLENSILVGNSYGGWLIAYYSILGYPARGLVLENPLGTKDYFDWLQRIGMLEWGRQSIIKNAMTESINNERVIKSICNDHYKKYLLTNENLQTINIPTLIIAGSRDVRILHKFTENLGLKINNSKTVVIKGGGHITHYSRPESMANAIEDFAKELRKDSFAKEVFPQKILLK